MDKPFVLNKEQYVLFLLGRLTPEKSTKFFLNKLAFLVEFAFINRNKAEKQLSDALYAAIPNGPVIDGYVPLFEELEKKGQIKIDGRDIRLITTDAINVPEDVVALALPLIEKYSALSYDELRTITHNTDSYKITTNNETDVTGKIIDKELALLETFLDSSGADTEEVDESNLPSFDRSNLVKYEFGSQLRG